MAIEGVGANNTSNGFTTAQSSLGKDEFLKLLITKLQYQDPLNPTDDEAFIADLAQFSSLEQMENMNGGLSDLALLQSNATNTSMVNYIGKTAILAGDTINLEGGASTINYELPNNAQTVNISIYSENGQLIKTIEQTNIQAGDNTLIWNGQNEQGLDMPEGRYKVKITATDSNGNSIPSIPRMTGKITGVTYENGYPELIIGGAIYGLGNIISVSE
jgi:flagellar basal-body rod modification protein FlgD